VNKVDAASHTLGVEYDYKAISQYVPEAASP